MSSKEDLDLRALTSVVELPLHPQIAETLKGHSLSEYLRSLSNLIVFIPHLYSKGLSGWKIQATYLSKILKAANPNIKFTNQPAQANVKFQIKDSFYFGNMSKYNKNETLNINLLKITNAPKLEVSSSKIRKYFGFEPKHRVVNLYQKVFGITNSQLPRKILSELMKSEFNVFIVCRDTDTVKEMSSQFSRVIKLSKMLKTDLPQSADEKILVINDLSGVMPYVHAASDVSIVSGSINQFEALNVFTPTLILASEATFTQPYWDIYLEEEVLGFLNFMPNTEVVSSVEEIKDGAARLLDKSRVAALPGDVDIHGTTALEVLFYRIESVIKSQIKN